ncbi:MAG: S-adenosyl-l-methionine hydroxide adenosyltransferase family protein [Bacteroidales bacterium]
MPIIALLTDFGTRDHYVASMKGVILRIVPHVTLVDITHEVAPQDVLSAAFELAACCREFPPGTIFVVVVDPGVGTPRRALGGSAGDYVFVGPDNGVLAPVLDRPGARVVELTNPEYARAEVSRTFEGRDRFAPAAAWLAHGVPLGDLGPAVARIAPVPWPAPHVREAAVAGEVLKVDRFGNLISNIDRRLLEQCACAPPVVRIAGCNVLRFAQTYGETAAGELCALVGSSGYLEVAVNGGSAAERLHAGRGTALYVGKDFAALDAVAGRID